jgi:hypothetical protein
VARRGDPAGSLLRLAHRLGLDRHESLVLRTIIFRESATHPDVREHLANASRAGSAEPDLEGAARVLSLALQPAG